MLNFKTKIFYGIGGICDNALYTFTSTYLLLFLTTVAKINPAISGLLVSIGSIWEAIMAPIIGNISDNINSKFGKRKPFLIIASLPVIIFTTLLFTNIDCSDAIKNIFYGLMIVLFWTAFSTEFIPYLSWGADLTKDYNERTTLRSYSYIFNQVGMLIGMVLPTIILSYLRSIGLSESISWTIIALFVSSVGGISLLICALNIKNTDEELIKEPKKEKKDFKKIIKEYISILKLRPILFLICSSMLYLISNTIYSASRVFYMTYNMGLDGKIISLMMFIITISGIIFVPFILKLSNRYEKKDAFSLGILISGIVLVILRFIGIKTNFLCIISCLFYSLANTCYWQLMPSMMYDVCEVEYLYSNESHSGSVISLQALSESISIALGSQMLGIILDLSKFNEEALVQTETSLIWINNLFTIIPGIFMVLVYFSMRGYKVNKSRFNEITCAINDRNKGKEIDISKFKDLF